ncbi:MAG: hypothetical protein M9896_04245 [Candidatus Promineofilum sp.]|uniref:hypothetical protein n=1 Tax=Promineifilum sp. TaxID=2664178 RepID=UPI002411A7A0|nr:hypothetical protein [Promineifilum sp.]
MIIAKAGTIFDNQLMWLFKLPQDLTATQSSFINQPEEVIDSKKSKSLPGKFSMSWELKSKMTELEQFP